MARARCPSLQVILLVALIVRAALFLLALRDESRFFTSDAGGYIALARDLGAGYVRPGPELFATGLMRTPGYPLFAAVVLGTTGSVAAIVAVQILLALATIWLTYRLGLELLGPREAALGALGLALDPVFAIYANQLQPEALFTLLVVAAILAWVRAVGTGSVAVATVAGACLGLAILTRPIALYLPLALLGFAFRSPRRGRLTATLLGLLLLLVGGWVARNAALTGVPLLTTIEGVNLLEYRAAGALARAERISIEDARERLRRRLARELAPGGNPAQVSRAQARLALDVMREHPWGLLQSMADGALRLAAGNGLTALSRLSGDEEPEAVRGRPVKVMATVALGLVLAALYGGAVMGAVALWHDRRTSALTLLIVVVAYFVLISAGPEANTRFRVPAMPFLALLAGVGWTRRLGKQAPPEPRVEAA